MSGQFDLGNHIDKPVCCISYHFTDLLLCIITAISRIVVTGTRVSCCNGSVPVTTNRCKQRVFLYLNPPSLVICQVPVERIEFMKGQVIQVSLDKIHFKKMP